MYVFRLSLLYTFKKFSDESCDFSLCHEIPSDVESEEQNPVFSNSTVLVEPVQYIEVIHHPHSGKSPTIIPLDSRSPSEDHPSLVFLRPNCLAKPWAPFRNHSDFEFTEEVINQGFPKKSINKLLQGFHGRWATNTFLTFQNYKDLDQSMAAARKFVVQVH